MPSRRQVLAAGCLALAGDAGCVADPPSSGPGTTSDRTSHGADDTARLRIAVVDGDDEVDLVTDDDVAAVDEIESPEHLDGYAVPVELTDAGTDAFTDGLDRVGAFDEPQSYEIRSYFEGELLHEAMLGSGLAESMQAGKWDGDFLLIVTDRETARRVRDALDDE